jgi:two-component system chemotaxis response regulator CheB
MNGVEFLRKLMPQFPIPVIMVSSLTERGQTITLNALELGAVDFVTKPSGFSGSSLSNMINELHRKIIAASAVDMSQWSSRNQRLQRTIYKLPAKNNAIISDKIIVLGASTGGTEALKHIIPLFPETMPPTLIVQHIPPGFSKLMADRLNQASAVTVKEAEHGDKLEQGKVLIAPGGRQMRLIKDRFNNFSVAVEDKERYNGHKPSVGYLFESIADIAAPKTIAVIMTGMGKDGATGLKMMRDKGARCIGQDESTSVVFGMAKEANAIGAVESLVPLTAITERIINIIKGINCE